MYIPRPLRKFSFLHSSNNKRTPPTPAEVNANNRIIKNNLKNRLIFIELNILPVVVVCGGGGAEEESPQI